jgi:hypothetical protein
MILKSPTFYEYSNTSNLSLSKRGIPSLNGRQRQGKRFRSCLLIQSDASKYSQQSSERVFLLHITVKRLSNSLFRSLWLCRLQERQVFVDLTLSKQKERYFSPILTNSFMNDFFAGSSKCFRQPQAAAKRCGRKAPSTKASPFGFHVLYRCQEERHHVATWHSKGMN